ncbi:MAG: Uma2 family endonuclease [Planctomycetes bacterium]|nr:Uma2 family endonuclease [Planctomycetota bacterium]
MPTVALPAEQRFLLAGVDWETYECLLARFEGRHLRLTYDEGDLEIMTVSPDHERAKKLLARFVEALTEELGLPVLSLGNTTFRRTDLGRGLEPDECWYIAHEAQMRGVTEIDLTRMPPPDLVIEVEISRGLLDRLDLYARLGVPEVWRYDGRRLRVSVLAPAGTYSEVGSSPTFPGIPLEGIRSALLERNERDETSMVKAFRAWVRSLPEATP